MAKRGRKRRQGKREPNGRIQRASRKIVLVDRGSDHAQAMQELYGQDGGDSIGRAFRSGLLGDGSDAKAMLDTARRIAKAYWAAYATDRYTCPLGDRSGGGGAPEPPENARRREEWLSGCIDLANSFGSAHRRNFDQLVIDINPDCGPDWLDRLCYASRTKAMVYEPADTSSLHRALEILSEIAGVDIPHVAKLKAA